MAYVLRISYWCSDVCSSDLSVYLEHLSVETVYPKPTKAGLLLSPTGNHGVKRDGDNLVLVDIARCREQRLTDDGEPYFSYGKMPDASLQYIPLKKSGAVLPPFGAAFSPDGRYLICPRIDRKSVE